MNVSLTSGDEVEALFGQIKHNLTYLSGASHARALRIDEIHFARVLWSLYIAFVLFQDLTTAVDAMDSWEFSKSLL